MATAISTACELTGDAAFRVHDADFLAVLGEHARLECVLECDAHEGPVYAPDEDALYFTSLPQRSDVPVPGTPRVDIRRLDLTTRELTTVRTNANAANGMTLDREGRIVICEQGTRTEHAAITRLDRRTGRVETLVDQWRGLRLNSPNDVIVSSDGAIWFTDPSYGHFQGFRPPPVVGDHVYRYEPASGRLAVVADSFVKPNGIVLSPDERTLYVTDSGANQEPGSLHPHLPRHVIAFEATPDGRLGPGRLFAVVAPGFPDGIKVDADGRVYVSSASGVQVFTPRGDLIGEIALPGAVNFAFADNVLFVTTDDAVWAATLGVTAPPPPPPRGVTG